MAGEPDDTVRIVRPVGIPDAALGRRVRYGVLAAVFGLALAGGAAWFGWGAWRGGVSPVASGPVVAPLVVAPGPVLPVLALADEAGILARGAGALEAVRFASQPEIVVLLFSSFAEQAGALNRMAALVERAGFSRTDVLGVGELNARIRATGEAPDTLYFGHDYRAADVLRFFEALDRSGLAPTDGEAALRLRVAAWGWRTGVRGALISLVRPEGVRPEGVRPGGERPGVEENGVTAAARATILRHELSHGLYFVDGGYAAYSRSFWEGTLTEAERARFRLFLSSEGYDTGQEDLVINETQAYLMHTANPRFFNARAVGISEQRLDALRVLFLTGMPPGWLRDCTVVPGIRPRRRRVARPQWRRVARPQWRRGAQRGVVRRTRMAAEAAAGLAVAKLVAARAARRSFR